MKYFFSTPELESDVKTAIGDHAFDLLTRQEKPGSTERRTHSSSHSKSTDQAIAEYVI
ncbi:hypothetical protein ACQ4M4_21390 [Leptolyngbya sp. AN02str]|uniref:hypothetical protein n=1 Tax=Leptolyngbya sp. AN02str TaxID=3423363 RepID=UPI003D31C5A0